MFKLRWLCGLMLVAASVISTASAQDAEIKTDDTVVVTTDSAKFMLGATVLATVPKDTELKVIKINGNWIGVAYKVGEEEKGGWINKRNLSVASAKPETPKPETPKPETPKPETPKPETKPETPKPETKPETPKPETKPETPKPETKPETPKPETKPETPKPETKPEVEKKEEKKEEEKKEEDK